MKFSRNDLPFRKAPENLLESADSKRERYKIGHSNSWTCHGYDADGLVPDVVPVEDFVERLLVQEELVCLALIINLHNLYCLPHINASQIILKAYLQTKSNLIFLA